MMSVRLRIFACSLCLALAAPVRSGPPPAAQDGLRTWTSRSGASIEARLVKQEYGNVYLHTLEGKDVKIGLVDLSRADQDYLRTMRAAKPAGKTEAAENDSVFSKLMGRNLVSVQKKNVKRHKLETNPDYYAFYFSASWCGPCRQFTPHLVEFYKQTEKYHDRYEIVLVSADRSSSAMETYMKDAAMPWPALKFEKSQVDEVRKYAGRGIPCLVLVDKKGKVISHSYVGKRYVGPGKVMADLTDLLKQG